jgi:hypothetical protein
MDHEMTRLKLELVDAIEAGKFTRLIDTRVVYKVPIRTAILQWTS